MRVCKHGCGVKMFCFSRANHASTNLKKFSSSKLDKFTLFTHSFVSLRTADAFPVVASLPPKNSVCEPERQNDSAITLVLRLHS